MKIRSKKFILWMAIILLSVGPVVAQEWMDHGEMMGKKGSMGDDAKSELPNVGNKICPVSREVIAGVGEGKGIQI